MDSDRESLESGVTTETESGIGNSPTEKARPYRSVFIVAATLLLIVGGFVAYGIIDDGKAEKPPVPTAAVTYEITGKGTANITYLARSVQGKSTTLRAVALPWKKAVRVPLGKEPTVQVQLSVRGGEARCTLAIRGEHVQRATALGPHGRATCAAAELTAGRR
ncbi:hypothetical protein [Streptomyces boninensis]|uniref:hypothetical protein n=1 Tax=Streptomyces boninensis TaxID=2039455 RepID=UPI003B221C13